METSEVERLRKSFLDTACGALGQISHFVAGVIE
jgi:hypothetical protein